MSRKKNTMSALELRVYEIFKNKLGEKEAETLIEYFEAKAEAKYVEKKDVLATKDDLANAKTDIIKWMFVFWVGTIGVLSAIMFAMLNAYLR